MKPINEAGHFLSQPLLQRGLCPHPRRPALPPSWTPTLDEVNDIKTAVSEAVTNAIVHAYPDRLGKVALRLRLF